LLNKLKPKSEFSKNVLTLMTGTTIAQAIPIAISPILTRIYTPEDFGVFALYMSIASIMAAVATGKYELAIMLPKKDEDAINIVVLSIVISFFVSFIAFLIVFIFNAQITNLLGNRKISNWLYFIPITVLLTGIYQSFNYWLNRKKQYKKLATSTIVQTGTTATSNLVMGFYGFESSGLILGNVFGQIVATTILGKYIWKKENYRLSQIKKLKIFELAKKYINFFKYSTFSSLLNSLSFNLLSILLSKIFSATVLGFYSLVYRILTLPSALIGSSISQVYFQESTKYKNIYGNNKVIFLSTLKKLTIISGLIYIPMYFYIVDLITFVFGEEWKISGEIAKILIPLMFVRFISSNLSSTLMTYEKQKSGLFINLLLIFNIISISFFSSFYNLSYITFFYIYVVTSTVLYFIFLFYYYHLSKGENR
jgi:O-antigen/teichoic acid export membrane protein